MSKMEFLVTNPMSTMIPMMLKRFTVMSNRKRLPSAPIPRLVVRGTACELRDQETKPAVNIMKCKAEKC